LEYSPQDVGPFSVFQTLWVLGWLAAYHTTPSSDVKMELSGVIVRKDRRLTHAPPSLSPPPAFIKFHISRKAVRAHASLGKADLDAVVATTLFEVKAMTKWILMRMVSVGGAGFWNKESTL
jgi:hypothetical protein